MDNSILIAILAFNVVIIGYQFMFNWDPFSWLSFMLGLLLACAAAAGAFVAAGGAKRK